MLGKMVYYITVILIVLFYISIGNVMTEADTTYIDDIIALSDLGCTWSYANIHGWGKLDTDYLSLSELEKELCQGMEDFFPHGYHNIEKDINDKVRYITMEGQNHYEQAITIIGSNSAQTVTSMNSKDAYRVANTQYHTYIIVDIVDRIPLENWEANISKLKMYFKDRNCSPVISYNLFGYYNGMLNSKQREEKCKEVLKRLGATHVDSMESDTLISLTGYVSSIGDIVETPKGPVNINVASRYNSFEDRTYIVIGTPIINIEY